MLVFASACSEWDSLRNRGARDGASEDAAIVAEDGDSAALDDAAVDDASTDDGAVTDGAVTDGAVTDGAVTDGAVTDGAVTDGAVTDGGGPDVEVTDIVVGDGACAIRGGQVYCWGGSDGSLSGLGGGSPRHINAPLLVPGLPPDAVQVAILHQYACARYSSGDVWCWGNVPGYVNSLTATLLTSDIIDLELPCALRTDRSVECWGSGASGAFGDGDGSRHGTMTPIPGATGINDAVDISRNCAVRSDGSVWCWAEGGLADATNPDLIPVQVRGISTAIRVVSPPFGPGGGCALLANGTAVCWGDIYDQDQQVRSPQAIPLTNISDLSTGYAVSNGRLYVISSLEQLSLASVTRTRAGGWVSCSIAGGQLFCLGNGGKGTLGIGDRHSWSDTPTLVEGVPPVVELAASTASTFIATTADGRGFAWGRGYFPDATTWPASLDRRTPRDYPELRNVRGIQTGYDHACGLRSGAVVCWGVNRHGVLGAAEVGLVRPAITISGLVGQERLFGAWQGMCSRSGTSLSCWGDALLPPGANRTGQYSYPTSTAVQGFSVADDILALGADGRFCAKNSSEQVICGSLVQGPYQVVAGLTGTVVGIATVPGSNWSYHIWNSAGALWSVSTDPNTGFPYSEAHRIQEVGNTDLMRERVVGVVGGVIRTASGKILSYPNDVTLDVTSLASAGGALCAIRTSDSRVVCWGNRGDGAFGDGDTGVATTPERVTFPD